MPYVKDKNGNWIPTGEGSGGRVTAAGIKAALGYTPANSTTVDDLSQQIADLGGTLTEPAEDDIPKVFFGGALQQTKDEAVVPFRYISKTQDISGYAEIKAQGNSSMSYPKKNQTVKLYKDAECTEKLKVDFKGWGEQNKFCFKANWIDITHSRNVVSARLWGDIVKSRTAYEELPERLRTSPNQGAVDGFPVKVYAAGVYQGRYTINIPKDKWMANMDDELDEHCILCGEGYEAACFLEPSMNQWTDEIHDAVPDIITTRWLEIINFVINSTDEEFKANLGNYFYIDSLIDYNLFGLFSTGIDAYGKNQLYMTYDGLKWFATMYDMDSTWGLSWGGGLIAHDFDRDSFEDRKNTEGGNLLYDRIEKLFLDELKARWTELKSGALSVDSVINRFERFTDIAPPELVAEDYAETTANGAFTAIPSKTSNTVQRLRTNIITRTTWVDEYLDSLVVVPCTGVTLSETAITISDNNAYTLIATVTPENTTSYIQWESSNTAIASVSDGVVTPLANGECVITVKCGNYSASCSVTVEGFETTGAKYQFANGTFTADGKECIISNGNHIKYPNLSTTNNNGIQGFRETGAHAWTETVDAAWFIIPKGSYTELKLNNISPSVTSADKLGFGIPAFSGTALVWSEVTYGDNYVLKTATTTDDYGAKWVVINLSEYKSSTTLEFDVELTVDGERWI